MRLNEYDFSKEIDRMKNGDVSGFDAIYHQTYKHVYYKAYYYLKNEYDALDLMQIVYMEIIKNINRLQSNASFIGWMNEIIFRQSMNYMKKNKEVLLNEEDSYIFDNIEEEHISSLPELSAIDKEKSYIIKSIIDDLSEEQRITIVMFYYDGLKIEQIATIQECSANTVKSRLNYAKKKIKERIIQIEKEQNIKIHSVWIPLFIYHIDEATKNVVVENEILEAMTSVCKMEFSKCVEALDGSVIIDGGLNKEFISDVKPIIPQNIANIFKVEAVSLGVAGVVAIAGIGGLVYKNNEDSYEKEEIIPIVSESIADNNSFEDNNEESEGGENDSNSLLKNREGIDGLLGIDAEESIDVAIENVLERINELYYGYIDVEYELYDYYYYYWNSEVDYDTKPDGIIYYMDSTLRTAEQSGTYNGKYDDYECKLPDGRVVYMGYMLMGISYMDTMETVYGYYGKYFSDDFIKSCIQPSDNRPWFNPIVEINGRLYRYGHLGGIPGEIENDYKEKYIDLLGRIHVIVYENINLDTGDGYTDYIRIQRDAKRMHELVFKCVDGEWKCDEIILDVSDDLFNRNIIMPNYDDYDINVYKEFEECVIALQIVDEIEEIPKYLISPSGEVYDEFEWHETEGYYIKLSSPETGIWTLRYADQPFDKVYACVYDWKGSFLEKEYKMDNFVSKKDVTYEDFSQYTWGNINSYITWKGENIECVDYPRYIGTNIWIDKYELLQDGKLQLHVNSYSYYDNTYTFDTVCVEMDGYITVELSENGKELLVTYDENMQECISRDRDLFVLFDDYETYYEWRYEQRFGDI